MRREELLQDKAETRILEQQSLQSRIWTALPAIIQEVDYQRFTITAQPAIQGRIENEEGEGEFVDLPQLVDVPLLLPNAGGWHITLPVQAGDECLVVFASRCIDAWWQNGGVQKPMERRMHDLSDAFAILAPYSQKLAPECLDGYSDKSIVIRDDKKSNFLEITNDGDINILHQKDFDAQTLGNSNVYIKGDATVKIDGNLNATVSGDITAQATNVSLKCSSLTVDCPSSTFTGNVQVNKTLTASNDCIGGGISLKGHVHTGVQSGSSKTGGPQ